MSRALVTFATGDHQRLQELSLPLQAEYADRHGYELHAQPPALMLRPPSWMKIAALLRALAHYEAVLWIDADVVIVELERDIADEIPAEAWQALVAHHTPDGEVPNCGVWYVRAPMVPRLAQLWGMTRYLHHGWWEQAALLDLLGYELSPARHVLDTDLYRRTHWLGLEWNSHEQHDPHPRPRFAHATAGDLDWRASVMRRHIARARELAHAERSHDG